VIKIILAKKQRPLGCVPFEKRLECQTVSCSAVKSVLASHSSDFMVSNHAAPLTKTHQLPHTHTGMAVRNFAC